MNSFVLIPVLYFHKSYQISDHEDIRCVRKEGKRKGFFCLFVPVWGLGSDVVKNNT